VRQNDAAVRHGHLDSVISLPIPPTGDTEWGMPNEACNFGTPGSSDVDLPLDILDMMLDSFDDNDGEDILDANMHMPLVLVELLTVDRLLIRLRRETPNALSKELFSSDKSKNVRQWNYAITKILAVKNARRKHSWKYSGGNWQRFLDSKVVAPEFPPPQAMPSGSRTKKRKGVQDSEQGRKHGSDEEHFGQKPHEGNPKRQCSQVRKLSELLPIHCRDVWSFK
jgi:hypothetical protein